MTELLFHVYQALAFKPHYCIHKHAHTELKIIYSTTLFELFNPQVLTYAAY